MEKFLIIEPNEEEITYVGEVTKTKVKLRRSKSDIWGESAKGKSVGVLKDNGNIIEIKVGGLTVKLDYSEFMELYYLVTVKYQTDPNL